MSNNLKLEVLLKAVDQATRPFKAIQTASKSLSGDIRTTQQTLRDLNGQASKIDGFRKTSAQLAITGQSLEKAKQEAAALAVQFKNTENPTRAQARAMELAKKTAADLQLKYNGLRLSVQRQRQELGQAGINTRKLSSDELRLKNSISETTAQLNRQREALARVSTQQAKLNAVKSRYESGQKLAAGARNVGMAGVGVATSGLYAESRFIAPGIGFDKQMSGTQAILGLDKKDEKLAAIRQQARDIGATTAFSPGDVARTQTTLARSGYNADDVLAATGSTVNLSLAADVDIAEAADIITNMQSSFNLPTTEIQRVADVMTKGFTSSNTGLVELGEAMKYVGPIAVAAGASIEDTTAMLGIMADNGLKGSMAGTGASAIFNRLQAPMGKAVDAIAELGVKTRDSKGNMLPVEEILKAIDKSFKKNKLGTAEKGEYLKVIFGEEAMKGAIKLVAAAGNGSLANKRREIQNSTGTTELIAKIQTDNLDGDLKNLQSAWEDLQIEVFEKQDSALRQLTQSATEWLGTVAAWTKANPELTKTLFTVVSGALAIVGVLGGIGLIAWPLIAGLNAIIAAAGVLSVAFSAAGAGIVAVLGGISLPVVAVVAAIVGGAMLISRYWGEAKAFVAGVGEGFVAIMGPISSAFEPFIPILKGVSSGVSLVCDWFVKLISPVKATQQELQTAGNLGKAFGKLLAYGIQTAISPLLALQKGIDIVLEKLGLVKKDSSALNVTADKTQPVNHSGEYIPATSSYGGYQAYQPVTAPAGKTYIDQSRPTYQINVPANGMPGGQLGNQLQDALDKYDREKRARARASMMHD